MGDLFDGGNSAVLANAIVYLKNVQKLELKEGDVLVLKHPATAPEGIKEALDDIAKGWGYQDIKVLILEEGTDLHILRCADCHDKEEKQ